MTDRTTEVNDTVTTHTPGPWRWVMQASGIGEASEYDSDTPALVSVHGPMVCWFGNDGQYYPTEGIPPGVADMALMAAAPDLLFALGGLIREHNHSGLRDSPWMTVARAAIARATQP